MYYQFIHDMVRKAAADQGISITTLLETHEISKATYYWRLKHGSSWKIDEVKALAEITGKSTTEILNSIL